MKAGTTKERKYLPVHAIVEQLQKEPEVLKLLPGFHALTGSDSTSTYITWHTKTCRDVFVQHHHLLKGLGEGPELSDHTIQNVEEFVCKLYGATDAEHINAVRASMFVKGMTIERLPPTRDAFYLHIQCSHFQTVVWSQANLQQPVLPPPETAGWKMEEQALVPQLMSLPPVPDACEEFISCACSTGCKTGRCGCKPNPCTASCKCRRSSNTCMNQ